MPVDLIYYTIGCIISLIALEVIAAPQHKRGEFFGGKHAHHSDRSVCFGLAHHRPEYWRIHRVQQPAHSGLGIAVPSRGDLARSHNHRPDGSLLRRLVSEHAGMVMHQTRSGIHKRLSRKEQLVLGQMRLKFRLRKLRRRREDVVLQIRTIWATPKQDYAEGMEMGGVGELHYLYKDLELVDAQISEFEDRFK